MRCLVTGASGFIGKHLVKMLEERGDEVIKVDRKDLVTFGLCRLMVNHYDPNTVFHLGAYGQMSNQKDDREIFYANLGNTFNLLKACSEIDFEAFINVSSSSVLLPHLTMYAATKIGAEALCKAFYDEYDKPIATVRPYSVYGPGEADFRFIPTVFRSCLKGEPMTLDPDATHDWVYVEDLVRGMINTADNIEQFKGKALNLGTGFSHTNSQVVQIIEDITSKRANVTETKKLRSFDTENWKSDTRAGEYIKLRDGLKLYYDSIR